MAQDLSTSAGRRAAWINSLFVDHAVLRLGWRNWGVVAPGRLYRSNHPSPWQIRRAVRQAGIRSIVNLRGLRENCGSDALGRAMAAELGLNHVDAPLESRGAPHLDRLLRLAGLFASLPEPVLIHCKSGADRTGLAAGFWLLLQGQPVEEALRQLTLRHGHLSASKTGILDAFFRDYAAFQKAHGPKPILDWLREDYDEDRLRHSFRSQPWADRITDSLLRRE
ncbi:tyrosine-protein phosphatase [Roseomonas sp. GC11]|uniref:tyrosine-protein phosphatase n=1 Tax=Roseomonas sp. GC11 TaxID=2950546 RepID=UPI00210B5120|nr:tyrosine-protein phosphatase [Roseomonas sp. GC11]MCQ4161443.1 tyrosine-protein phosphatase [Roseomonas sp. GC11]